MSTFKQKALFAALAGLGVLGVAAPLAVAQTAVPSAIEDAAIDHTNVQSDIPGGVGFSLWHAIYHKAPPRLLEGIQKT